MNSGDCVETREEGTVTATGYYAVPTDALGFPCAGDAKLWFVECTRWKRPALRDGLEKELILRFQIRDRNMITLMFRTGEVQSKAYLIERLNL